MWPMPICEFGDTVVVPFPFTDIPVSKRRPSVVLSSASFNRASGQSILAMITTAANSRWDEDIMLSDLDIAGIPHPSVVRFKLFTLPNELLLRQLGYLCTADQAKLRAGISRILG